MAAMQKVEAEVVTKMEGNPDITINPVSIDMERRRYSEQAGTMTVEGLSSTIPAIGETMEIVVNESRIATGQVTESTETDSGVVKVKAVDGTYRLHNNKVSRNWTRRPVLEAARGMAQEYGMDFETDFESGQYRNLPTESVTITDSFTNKKGTKVMNLIRNTMGGVWYVDAFDTLHLESDPPTDSFDLRYVISSDAGDQVPPFSKIVVHGAFPEGNTENKCLIQETPPRATAELDSHQQGGDVYHYTNNTVVTDEGAQTVADGVIKEMERQEASGTIEIVGHEGIYLFDAVTLPDVKDLSGESYAVSGVQHRVDSSNGFTTNITVSAEVDS